VQVALALTAQGPLACSQTWTDMAQPTGAGGAYQVGCNTGVSRGGLPGEPGSLSQRNDGLVGYFLPDFNHLYTLHGGTPGTYLQPIVMPAAGSANTYSGNIGLRLNGDAVVATLLLAPRGSVHAYSGIRPVASVALDPHLADDFLNKLQITFQTGPLVLDAGTIRTPLPAEQQGVWQWLQQQVATDTTPATWQQSSLVAADATARLSLPPPCVKAGFSSPSLLLPYFLTMATPILNYQLNPSPLMASLANPAAQGYNQSVLSNDTSLLDDANRSAVAATPDLAWTLFKYTFFADANQQDWVSYVFHPNDDDGTLPAKSSWTFSWQGVPPFWGVPINSVPGELRCQVMEGSAGNPTLARYLDKSPAGWFAPAFSAFPTQAKPGDAVLLSWNVPPGQWSDITLPAGG